MMSRCDSEKKKNKDYKQKCKQHKNKKEKTAKIM